MSSHRQRRILAALSVVVLGTGCISTRHVARPATAADLQETVAAAGGPVTLLEGPPSAHPLSAATTRELRPVAINPDGIWAASGAEAPKLLEVKDLLGFEARRRGRGALEGFAIGLLAGAAAGAAVGYGTYDNSGFFDRESTTYFMGVFGAGIGALSGAILGALAGHSDLYLFDPLR